MLKIRKDILAALAYFDMWDYPLIKDEIFLFLPNVYSKSDFDGAINDLAATQTIFNFENCYALKNDYQLVIKRKKGNRKATELMITARQVSRFLIKFPFVRGVGISGSLSKNYADKQSDIDLFIITKKNRLWIARTLMHVFKKLTFLIGKQHHFCMNYYVDEKQLEIEEKNIYTAIEVATIIPLEGSAVFEDFYRANQWITNLLPNHCTGAGSARALKENPVKNFVERLFNAPSADQLDDYLMRITSNRWRQKTRAKKLNMRGTIMGMAASKHCAKPDPQNFQNKLIEKYQQKKAALLFKTANKIAF
ncbi:nucleotidyltransferase domain-containing protein [Dyadobacter frigoris]|uniref:Polymerase nucleotidyl transferase domain-containing protein n=1 Tax=Dyadobacter frigoris TaxID=2576211 RepID=A0A4U6D3V5_9BACT|nr:nucleotidyltransferase domain-containing protein [Dyadobacter frigoris]TKT90608.1 hypothetical protein FDK13_20000 [Dyadobacter frigoris]GLU51243.1 hypothetical protein Dfri01_07040 [Dyadobacter frigoris]